MAKKPTIDVSQLQEYKDALQAEFDELEEKQGEIHTYIREGKMDELQNRIDLVEVAIDAMEAVQ